MAKPLSFRPIGKTSFFGDRGNELTDFLIEKYGELPVTLSIDDIPSLESWYTGQGGTLPVRGVMGILINQIKKCKVIQVGHFDVV